MCSTVRGYHEYHGRYLEYRGGVQDRGGYHDKCGRYLEYRVHVPNFGGLSGSEDRGGGDNSIQFINFGRVGDKSFKEWRQKIGGWKGG